MEKRTIKLAYSETVNSITDMSLICCLKIIAIINRKSEILEYNKNEVISDAMGGSYKVTLSFGMHIGWSIEGAIGSNFKIDASYISPHVNTASRLTSASK